MYIEDSNLSLLTPEHKFHLRSEGFSPEQISQLQEMGVCSLSEKEAKLRDLKVWDKSDRSWRSSSGIYFPFTAGFGQIRCDEPLDRGDGKKPAKYLTPAGATSQAFLPDGCQVITEGFKDAIAGCLHGEIPTGAMAGVSHYRKALKSGSGYTILFDSDGWQNPQVFSNLVHAGKYLNGKVQLLPEIAGQPKAGLCEYFKSGRSAADYQNLIKAAQHPEQILLQWPLHWQWNDWSSHTQERAVVTAFTLSALYGSTMQQQELLQRVQKASGLSKGALNQIFNERVALLRKSEARQRRNAQLERIGIEKENIGKVRRNEEAIPEGYTADKFCYHSLFKEGRGDWAVIDSAFYRYQEDGGYWKKIEDVVVTKLVSDKLNHSYRLQVSQAGERRIYTFANEKAVSSSFKFCRTILERIDRPVNNHLRAFRNCTVDLRTGQSQPHSPKHLLTSAIAVDYKQGQDCPKAFERFIRSAFGADMLPVIRAATSMLLDPTAPYGKFIHLLGPSGSGKGTLLRFWQELFGLENSKGGSSFSEFSTAEQRHQNLTGCSLYVLGDMGGYQKDLRAFYDLVDNAPMGGRALFSSTAYQKKWNTRFAIASVDHLQIENSGDGWDRRVIVIPSNPRRAPADPTLESRLAECRGQVASWALAMPRQERDRILANPAAVSDRIANAMHDTAVYGDSIKAFIDSCLRPTPDEPGNTVPAWLLHEWYRAYCRVHGYQPKAQNSFLGHFKTTLPSHYLPRHRENGAMVPAQWVGFDALPGVFESPSFGSQGDGYQGDRPTNPVIECCKEKCKEGGLDLFQNPPAIAEQQEIDLPNEPELTPTEPEPNEPVEPESENIQQQTESEVERLYLALAELEGCEDWPTYEKLVDPYPSETRHQAYKRLDKVERKRILNLKKAHESQAESAQPNPIACEPLPTPAPEGEAVQSFSLWGGPVLHSGQQVTYCGVDAHLLKEFAAGPLEIRDVNGGEVNCWSRDKRRITIWIDAGDLKPIGVQKQ